MRTVVIDDFADIARLLQRSLIGRLADAVVSAAARAVAGSRVVASLRGRLVVVAGLAREERVRLVATSVIGAAGTAFILSAFIPERSAPAIPRALWLLILLAAAVPAATPRSVVTAWENWRPARSRADS